MAAGFCCHPAWQQHVTQKVFDPWKKPTRLCQIGHHGLMLKPETFPFACAEKGEALVAMSDVQLSFDVLFVLLWFACPSLLFSFSCFGNSEVLSSWP